MRNKQDNYDRFPLLHIVTNLDLIEKINFHD